MTNIVRAVGLYVLLHLAVPWAQGKQTDAASAEIASLKLWLRQNITQFPGGERLAVPAFSRVVMVGVGRFDAESEPGMGAPNPLRHVRRDLNRFYRFVTADESVIGPEDVTVLCSAQPDDVPAAYPEPLPGLRRQARKDDFIAAVSLAVDELSVLPDGDGRTKLLLIYFTGHGFRRDPLKTTYLAFQDARANADGGNDLRSLMSPWEMDELFSQAHAANIYVVCILACCESDGVVNRYGPDEDHKGRAVLAAAGGRESGEPYPGQDATPYTYAFTTPPQDAPDKYFWTLLDMAYSARERLTPFMKPQDSSTLPYSGWVEPLWPASMPRLVTRVNLPRVRQLRQVQDQRSNLRKMLEAIAANDARAPWHEQYVRLIETLEHLPLGEWEPSVSDQGRVITFTLGSLGLHPLWRTVAMMTWQSSRDDVERWEAEMRSHEETAGPDFKLNEARGRVNEAKLLIKRAPDGKSAARAEAALRAADALFRKRSFSDALFRATAAAAESTQFALRQARDSIAAIEAMQPRADELDLAAFARLKEQVAASGRSSDRVQQLLDALSAMTIPARPALQDLERLRAQWVEVRALRDSAGPDFRWPGDALVELERAEARLGRLEADRLGQEQEVASRHAQIDHERTGGNVARAAELAKMLLRDRHEMRFPLVGEVVGRWSALEELAGEEELPIVCSLMDVRTPVRVAWKADGDRAEYPFNVAKLYLAHKGAGNVTIKWEASVILRRERQPEEVVWAGPGTNKTLRREDSPMALPVDVPFRLWAGLPSSRLLGDGTVQAGTADLWLRVVCTEQKQSDGRRPRRTVVEVPFSIQVFGVERKSP